MFKKIQITTIILAVVSLIALFTLVSGDLRELILVPTLVSLNKIIILLSAYFGFLRIRDMIVGKDFDIDKVEKSLPLAVYYSIPTLGLILALALILM